MASVLETFYILFKGDTTDLKKGSVEAKKTTDDLQKSLKDTQGVTDKLGGAFNGMIRQATGALAAVVGIGAIIGGLKYATHFADRLGELSQALGVNVEELSAWGDAVAKSGGTAEGFQGTLKGLVASLSDFAVKGMSRNAIFFEQLGIKMVDAKGRAREVFDILPELAGSFEKLTKAESFGIGQKLGLDEGTIMLLQKGRREVDLFISKQKELGVVTNRDAEIAARFNDTWDDMKHAFRSLAIEINRGLLPFLTVVVQAFTDLAVFLRKNTDLLKVLGIALGALFIYFAPIAAGIAAISAAVFILYDDIKHFNEGSNSVIGELTKKWSFLIPLFKLIGTVFEIVFTSFMFRLEMTSKALSGLFDSIEYFYDLILALGPLFQDVWGAILDTINVAVDGVMSAINRVVEFYKNAKSFFGFGGDDLKATVDVAHRNIVAAGNSPLNSQSAGSILNSSNRTNSSNTTVAVGDVTIQTQATDASGIAAEFGKSLSMQIDQALNTADDGVMA